MGTTGYQKYIPVTIATDVSEETVAAIAENQDELEGISVAEDTIRKYKDGPYYSQIPRLHRQNLDGRADRIKQ